MPEDVKTLLEPVAGCASEQVALLLWQAQEVRAALLEDLDGLHPEDLSWQVSPSSNTIGMLLAHLAIVEVNLVQVGLLREASGHVEDILGIDAKSDGMPLAPGTSPPAILHGKDLAYFMGLLKKARALTLEHARQVTDVQLREPVPRPRSDGSQRWFDAAFVLFHIAEHEAGHAGQIAMLQRLGREAEG